MRPASAYLCDDAPVADAGPAAHPRQSGGRIRLSGRVRGELKGWLTLDGEFFMGPRYVQLLEGIAETGTIREGCKATRMSYRTCLNRIREMERALGTALVVTTRGGAARGRSQLTPAAHTLIRVYRYWRSSVAAASDQAFAQVLTR